MKKSLVILTIFLLCSISSCSNKKVENEVSSGDVYTDEDKAVLGRGIVSYIRDRSHVLLSWRLLPEDPKGVFFNIYRKETGKRDEDYKWIARTGRTSFLYERDAGGNQYAYAVRPVHEEKEGGLSRASIALASIGGKAAMVFNLGQPYKQARVVTGDLNGDGELEVVVAYSGHQNTDPDKEGGAWSKSGDTVKVAAFLPTGERLWTVDLGWGIESGLNYQPMVVWDLDGKGRADVILKTNKSADPLDYSGERISVLDGMTGKIKMEAKWPSLKGLWSEYGNDSRNYLAIAHLNGKDPYLIAARGQYKTQKMEAFDKNLHRVWERTFGLDIYSPSGLRDRVRKFWHRNDKLERLRALFTKKWPEADQYRGSHCLPVSDINDDGKEEIFWGERCVGENGNDLWTIKEKIPYPGHADVVFPARILPSHKGKEIFFGREGGGDAKTGVYLADHQGKILWAHWGYHHIDRGWVGKILADKEGMQCFGLNIVEKVWSGGKAESMEASGFLWGYEGKLIGNPPASWDYSFPVDWDGDGVREIVIEREGIIQKYAGTVLEKLSMKCLWGADLFGDHREEIVVAPGDGNIYIFMNTGDLDISPRIAPMADRQYKNDLSRTAMLDTVIPTEGGYIPRKLKR